MGQDFTSYAADVNLGLRMLGAPEATESEIRDYYGSHDTDEAAEAIVHYRHLAAARVASNTAWA